VWNLTWSRLTKVGDIEKSPLLRHQFTIHCHQIFTNNGRFVDKAWVDRQIAAAAVSPEWQSIHRYYLATHLMSHLELTNFIPIRSIFSIERVSNLNTWKGATLFGGVGSNWRPQTSIDLKYYTSNEDPCRYMARLVEPFVRC
jgi:hypothetical protein